MTRERTRLLGRPLFRRAAQRRCRAKLLEQSLELDNDRLPIQFIFHEALNAMALDHSSLLKECEVAGHDRAVLYQVACHFLDVGAPVLKQDQNDLLTHWFCYGAEEIRIKLFCQGGDRAFSLLRLFIVNCDASALRTRRHVVPWWKPVCCLVFGHVDANGSHPGENLHSLVFPWYDSAGREVEHFGAFTPYSSLNLAPSCARVFRFHVGLSQHENNMVRGVSGEEPQPHFFHLSTYGGNA